MGEKKQGKGRGAKVDGKNNRKREEGGRKGERLQGVLGERGEKIEDWGEGSIKVGRREGNRNGGEAVEATRGWESRNSMGRLKEGNLKFPEFLWVPH